MGTVQYENIIGRDDASAGRLTFALVTSKSAEEPFTVRVCKRELNETSSGPTSDGSATGYLPLVYV